MYEIRRVAPSTDDRRSQWLKGNREIQEPHGSAAKNYTIHVVGNDSLPAVPTRQYNYLRGVFADTTFVYGDTPTVLKALIR